VTTQNNQDAYAVLVGSQSRCILYT